MGEKSVGETFVGEKSVGKRSVGDRILFVLLTNCSRISFQYYFVLQTFHKSPPYFVLHTFHKFPRNTALYYKLFTNFLPILLCTTTFSQISSHYYFVLQAFHKVPRNTALYYKLFTNFLKDFKCIGVLFCAAA